MSAIAGHTLRLLLVEDSQDDAQLIEREIRRGGFDPAVTHVASAAAMRVELRSHTFDLIICDHNLNGSSSADALAALREAELDVPLLIVSGVIADEAAFAAMRAGARDYLGKDRLGRLVPVIERELAQAAERKAGRAAQAQLAGSEADGLKEATERARVFEVLHEISTASSGILDIGVLAELTVQGAIRLLGADDALIRWWDPEKQVLRLLAQTHGRNAPRRLELAPARSLLGECFLSRKATVRNDYQQYRNALETSRLDGVTGVVAVPLLDGDRALGALGVVGYGDRRFTPADARILGFLGSQVRAAITAAQVSANLVDSVSLLEQSQEVGAIGTFVAWLTPEKAGRDEFSPMSLKIFGYTRETYNGTNDAFWARVHPDDIERVREAQAVAHRSGSIYDLDHRIVRPDGEVRWIHERAVVERDAEGNPQRFLGVTQDITESMAAVTALVASEARNAAVINATLDAMIVMDAEMVVTAFNPAAERMFGLSKERIIGHELAELLIPERFRDAHRAGVRRNVEAGVAGLSRRVELIALRADGTEFPIELSMSRLETDGTPFFSGSIRDLTDRDRLGESQQLLAKVVAAAPVILFACDSKGVVTLAQGRAVSLLGVGAGLAVGSNVFEVLAGIPEAVEHVRRGLSGESFAGGIRLEAVDLWLEVSYDPIRNDAGEVAGMVALATDVSDRVRADAARQESDAKARMVAIVNHEVRTPLNSILGFAELLKLERVGPLNDRQKRYVTNVESAGRHLLALVNDSLDLSKMAAGKMELEIAGLPVAAIVEEAADQIQPLIEETGLEIELDTGGELWIMADRRRLLQILWNLISNAIRHTAPGGKLTIQCRLIGGVVEIVVTDTGAGMPADQLVRIFEDYTQVGVKADGTGLGLPVSRRLAQLMDGDIGVVSEPGVGSSFTITLPAGHPPTGES